MGYPP
ncbi:hypothetical protein YPPY19_1400, partial [Yersinia pestis PY-19]